MEVKCRADGFRELSSWLDGRDLLIAKADWHELFVVAVAGVPPCDHTALMSPLRRDRDGPDAARPSQAPALFSRASTASSLAFGKVTLASRAGAMSFRLATTR
jgi:hypothetical protein